MKRAISVLAYVLFALVVFLPLGVVLFACYGYTIELANYSVFALVTALVSMCVVILCIIENNPIENKAVAVLLSLVAPLSLINAVFYLFESSTLLVVASMFICICCCCYLAIKHGKPMNLKIFSLVLSALIALPIGYFGVIALLFGNFGQTTVVKSVGSPNGAYYAEVIDSDQGALGGDTLVVVYENKCINALILKISKQPQTVYHGDWGEFENMKIYWEDENCLVINSVKYNIE